MDYRNIKAKTSICNRCGEAFDYISPRIRQVCDECKAKLNKELHKKRKAKAYKTAKRDIPITRVCHDCGEPCNDYRCVRCWENHRRKNNVTIDQSNIIDNDFTESGF